MLTVGGGSWLTYTTANIGAAATTTTGTTATGGPAGRAGGSRAGRPAQDTATAAGAVGSTGVVPAARGGGRFLEAVVVLALRLGDHLGQDVLLVPRRQTRCRGEKRDRVLGYFNDKCQEERWQDIDSGM